MKYLIFGRAGQLGHSFVRLLGARATALDRAQADITDPKQTSQALSTHRPAVVLNCAAYNNVDQAEEDHEAAYRVNAEGPGRLAEACRKIGAFFVHFSTNYVFGQDETRATPYRETDPVGAVNRYGEGKLAGERLVAAQTPSHLIIRTSALFGRRAPGAVDANFAARMIQLAREKKTLRVVNDQTCTPTSTDDLARATLALLDAGAVGLFHVTNGGACTWHEFARTALAIVNVEADLRAVSSAELGAAARRPRYSVLDHSKSVSVSGRPLRNWDEALEDYLATSSRQRFSPLS